MYQLSYKITHLFVLLTSGILLIDQAHAQLDATQQEDIGFTALQTKLGASMPTGAGISVSQIEASEGTNYRPDASIFTDKNFIYPSGGSTGVSSHATTVGRYLYGSSSLAPGIGLSPNRVTSYEANSFLGANFLNATNTAALPSVERNDVQNHSWIGDATNEQNVDVTRRIDYAIQRDDFIAVFGLNNGSSTSVPALMAGAYNGITVGLSNGDHSRGGIALDGGLRTRPDIVVPTTATSWATATVASASAVLIQSARGIWNADHSVVIKSLFLTGATRDESEFAGAWSHSSTQPLDAVFGAGELNVLRSHDVLLAGEYEASASSTVENTGWDWGTSDSATSQLYFFDLDTENSTFDIAASLVWNREITATDTQPGFGLNYVFNPTLANLNLRLFSATGFILGSEIEASFSEVDNVELITSKGLTTGRYAWQVTSDRSGVNYGFSWNLEKITTIPESSISAFMLAGILIFLPRRR